MNPVEQFKQEQEANIKAMTEDSRTQELGQEFLKGHPEFQSDDSIVNKSVISSCPGGWLQRIE